LPILAPVLRRGTAGSVVLAAGSRQELLQQIKAVAYDVASRWGDEDSATIVITSPLLGRADVEAAFDEIDEKCHLDGIDLCVHRQQDERLRAVLEPSCR
jgi:hypothetical protein